MAYSNCLYSCHNFDNRRTNQSTNQFLFVKTKPTNYIRSRPQHITTHAKTMDIFHHLSSQFILKHTGCPRVGKKLRNLFVIKDINFFFFLDDSYASTAYSEKIAVYIQGVPIL
jgi:hypothetical protein